MVRHFLLTVGMPAHAQATRTARKRRIRAHRLHRRDWHVGSRGPGDNPAAARVASPTIASTSGSPGPDWWRWRYKNASQPIVQVIWRVHRRSRATSGVGRRYRSSAPQHWSGGFGQGHDHVLVTLHAISPDAMKSYSDRVCAWFAEGNASRNLAPRRDGVDGDARPSPCLLPKFTSDIPTASV